MSLDRPRGMLRSASRRMRLHAAALFSLILLCLITAQRAPAQSTPAKPAPAQPVEDKLEAARESVSAHRFAEAVPLLESELAEHPENDEARALLARVLSWQHRYDQSLAEYGRLLEKKPGDAGLRADRARVLAWSGRHEEAIKEFRVATAADPTNTETKIGLARALSWSGDLAGASMVYEELLAQNPGLGDAWLGLASVARWRGAPTAADRFCSKAESANADTEGLADERIATRAALLPSIGGGWTTSQERQYVTGADFTLETEGPFARASATVRRAAQLSGRVAWLTLTETPTVGDSANYDLESVVYDADVSLLRGYPWQASLGGEYRTFEQGSSAVLFPLAGDDTFFGWNARLWRFCGRLTPRIGAGREYLAIKATGPSGVREFQPGGLTNYEGGFAWQWNGRGTADWAASRGFYSDDNSSWMTTGGVTYRIKTQVPSVALDGRLTYRDWDFPSPSYFTPLQSIRGAAGISLTGYVERSGLDYGLRYEISALGSTNFGDIYTNAWTGNVSMTAFDILPIGIEGGYSVDNNSYETWFLNLSGSARW
jgi:tetratricopeptide (TPR) repeat protein